MCFVSLSWWKINLHHVDLWLTEAGSPWWKSPQHETVKCIWLVPHLSTKSSILVSSVHKLFLRRCQMFSNSRNDLMLVRSVFLLSTLRVVIREVLYVILSGLFFTISAKKTCSSSSGGRNLPLGHFSESCACSQFDSLLISWFEALTDFISTLNWNSF